MSRITRPKPELRPLDDRSVPAVLDGVPTEPATPVVTSTPVPPVAQTLGSVSGSVFADLNSSGAQDAADPPLAAVQVTARRSADNVVVATGFTQADGTFRLDNLPDGQYLIVASPTGSGPNAADIVRPVAITNGQPVGPLPLGVRATGTVSGAAFVDANANGRRDAGEAGIGGATVNLALFGAASGTQTTTTAADGSYSFVGVPDGSHRLTVIGSSAQGGTVGPLTVSVTGGAKAAVDAAFRPTSGISGTVSFAVPGSGGTAATPVGLPGVTVALDANGDGRTDAVTTTDGNGGYLFAGVPVGTHVVTVTAAGASGYTGSGNRQLVSTTGDLKTGVDVGVQFSGRIVGSTFIDASGDGKFAAGDTTIILPSVQLDLFNSGKVVTLPTQPGPVPGSYQVTNVPDGTHTLIVTPPGGYAATTATRQAITVANGAAVTAADVGYRATGAGSTVAVGNGDLAGATTFTFVPTTDGGLTAVQGNVITPPGKSTNTRTVMADVNGDGVDELITASGAGGAPVVRVFDAKTGTELIPNGISVFESSFLGGLNLAAGDFLKSGKAQIVVSADTGGGPRVTVLDPSQWLAGASPTRSKVIADFFGIEDTAFRGGARTAVGDVNGDGTPDLIVAAGTGGGPRVAIYDGRTVGGGAAPVRLVNDFFAFESGLRNGATVAVGDLVGGGRNSLIVGAGPGGSPRVVVFDGAGIAAGKGADATRLADFFVNDDTDSRQGTRITVKDVTADGKADLIATNGARAYVFTGPSVLGTYLTGQTPQPATVLNPFPQTNRGGLFVG